ncbi:MAG: hypothetical protein PHP20_10675, partial [Firmicutes bacterium]|nr:hypothetical protein [Bacillota bacterium]MDD4337691.1 hypothetical protein [Bacillota bacterium]MDD4793514.1 hypothetical protein [Bacillota bacterium]
RDSSVKVDRALILLIARKKTLAPDLSSFTLFGFQGTSAALAASIASPPQRGDICYITTHASACQHQSCNLFSDLL